MICQNCKKDFTPSKNDVRIKFCCEKCRIDLRKKQEYNKKYYQEHKIGWNKHTIDPEVRKKRNEQRKEKYATDEEYREKIKKKVREYHKNNPLTKTRQKLKQYGLTIDDYNRMLVNQNNKCAICGRNDYGDNQAKSFYVDHCHTSGNVRGLLCSKCNMGLGQFNDDVQILKNAISYLERNK